MRAPALERTLSRDDIELFAVISGDVNPAHVDEEYAHGDMFHTVIAHGMWGASLISTLLGTRLPGPGTIYLEQTLRFRRPVMIDDTVRVTVTVTSKEPKHHRVELECMCVNQRDETVIDGIANVIAPTEKVSRPRIVLPEVRMRERGVVVHDLLTKCRPLAPIRMAVVHPVDRDALLGALQAAQEGLIIPLLIGPEDRIRAAAAANDLDIEGLTVIATEHSHQAAATAVALARAGEVDGLMKGSLATEELLRAVLAPGVGLATDRRMSHAFVMDVPTYPRPLLITDAWLNVAPDLKAKRDIVQNAIDLALAIGVSEPKVAVLSPVERLTRSCARPWTRPPWRRWPSAARSAAAWSTGPSGSTTRSRQRPPACRGSPHRSPARRTSSSSPTSRAATCSSSSCTTSATRRRLGSCSRRACRSPCPAGPVAPCSESPARRWRCWWQTLVLLSRFRSPRNQ